MENKSNEENTLIEDENTKKEEKTLVEQSDNLKDVVIQDEETVAVVKVETNNDIVNNIEQEKINQNVDKHLRNKQRNMNITIMLFIVIAVIVIIIFTEGICNVFDKNVFKNVYIKNKDLSYYTREEVSEYLNTIETGTNFKTIRLMQEDKEVLIITPEDIDLTIDKDKMLEDIMNVGREGNFVTNSLKTLSLLLKKEEVQLRYKYDNNKLDEMVKEVKESLYNKMVDDSYIVDENNAKLIVTKGKKGLDIDEDNLKKVIVEHFEDDMDSRIVLNIHESLPKKLDVDVVYSEVNRKPQDAYLNDSTTPPEILPHKDGLDFDKEKLKNILDLPENNVEGKNIEFALTVTKPNVLTRDIKWDFYEYKIASFTTSFTLSDPNRVNNLKTSLNILNNKVIMSGEVFSFNGVVGSASTAQGFKASTAYVGGRIQTEVGGGICQTATTLYNAALLSNLEIVQRRAHSLPVSYVQPSMDATIYYPSLDLKFKNTRDYPIKIVTEFNPNGTMTISLYGTKQDKEYEVKITSKTLSTTPFSSQFIDDSSMAPGTQKVVQNGANGITSESYKSVYLDGTLISNELLNKDVYKPMPKIINAGPR